MYIKLIKLTAFLFLFILLSCNANKESDTNAVSTETTTAKDDDNSSTDKEAQKKALNDQSRACIALMNNLEPEMNAAYAAGDAVTANAIKTRIDSAATENAKIGQLLMALEQ